MYTLITQSRLHHIPLHLLAAQADEGLTFDEIIASLPTDPGSILALVLVIAFVGGIFYFGTRSGGSGDGPGAAAG